MNSHQSQEAEPLEKFVPDLANADLVHLVKDGILERRAKAWKMQTTQLRKFFDHIKNIEKKASASGKEFERELVLLIPMLKNAQARGLLSGACARDMEYMIRKVIGASGEQKQKAFKNMVDILEAIVAYHKYIETFERRRGE